MERRGITLCRHCGLKPQREHRRGLCRSCYEDLGVRVLHPRMRTRAKLGRSSREMVLICKGFGNDAAEDGLRPGPHRAAVDGWTNSMPLPPTPTTARPESLEKMRVMAWRIANGYHLHHPLDLRLELPTMLNWFFEREEITDLFRGEKAS